MTPVLLDTNMVIYSVRPDDEVAYNYVAANRCYISDVVRIESLGYSDLDSAEKPRILNAVEPFTVIRIGPRVVDKAIEFRQLRRIKLGDAIIAATAFVYELPLVTRKVADFRGLPDIRLVDPYAIGDT